MLSQYSVVALSVCIGKAWKYAARPTPTIPTRADAARSEKMEAIEYHAIFIEYIISAFSSGV
jgi:hypothetical protein